jgi:hypothetical protein
VLNCDIFAEEDIVLSLYADPAMPHTIYLSGASLTFLGENKPIRYDDFSLNQDFPNEWDTDLPGTGFVKAKIIIDGWIQVAPNRSGKFGLQYRSAHSTGVEQSAISSTSYMRAVRIE